MKRCWSWFLLIVSLVPSLARAEETLTIDRAIALALDRNERTKIADRQEDAAEARVDRAVSFFIPDLDASASYTRRAFETVRDFNGESVVLQSKNSLRASAALDLTLFDGRGFPLYRSAKLDREAVRASAKDQRRRLAFDVATAFLSSLAAGDVVRAAERRREFARTTLRDAEARYRAEMARGSDVTRAQIELANAEITLSHARSDQETAYLRLGFLIGGPIGGPLAEPADLLASARTSSVAAAPLVEEAEGSRLDLAALRFEADSLFAFAAEPLWRMVPKLALHSEIFAGNEAGFSGHSVDGFAGLTLSWNVYDGGERYADRSERTAAATIAELQADQLRRQTSLQIEEALAALRTARQAVIHAQNAAEQATAHAEQISALYRQGLATSLEASDASVLRFESEINLARERYGLAEALLDLRLALGVDPLGHEVS